MDIQVGNGSGCDIFLRNSGAVSLLAGMRHPLVSIIIPVFNAERFIADAIESARCQDYASTEIVVVDDGSTDGSAEIVKRFPMVRYFYQDNQGPAAARNRAVMEARGEMLAFLDADDIWKPEKLGKQMAAWEKSEEGGVVICETRLQFEKGMAIPVGYSQRMIEESFPAYIPSALLVDRKTFLKVGSFDVHRKTGEDIDWFMRAKDLGVPCFVMPETLFEKRIHGKNLTGKVADTRRSMMANLRASILRKRAQA